MYTEATDGRVKCGVGIIVEEHLANCIRNWKCVNERCVMVRLQIAGVWLIQVYNPTDDSDSDIKDKFYALLQE